MCRDPLGTDPDLSCEPTLGRHKSRVFIFVSLALGLYFVSRVLFLALTIDPFVPPDEVTHVGRVESFSNSFAPPASSDATYQYGLVTNTPPLYYWTLGQLLRFKPFAVPDLVYLRIINVVLSTATVVYAYRWMLLFLPSCTDSLPSSHHELSDVLFSIRHGELRQSHQPLCGSGGFFTYSILHSSGLQGQLRSLLSGFLSTA